MHHISRLKKKLKQASEILNADVQFIFQANNAGTGILMNLNYFVMHETLHGLILLPLTLNFQYLLRPITFLKLRLLMEAPSAP